MKKKYLEAMDMSIKLLERAEFEKIEKKSLADFLRDW